MSPVVGPVGPVGPVGVSGVAGPGAAASAFAPSRAAQSPSGVDFAAAMASGLESVQRMQATSSDLSVKAVTGELTDVHDYTIAATQAAVATELTVAIRNKAVEAFQEIMRMPV